MSPIGTPTRTLSEHASKALLIHHGIPVPPEIVCEDAAAAVAAAEELGCPVVAKLGGDGIAHKTERGLVRLGLATPEEVHGAATELLAAATPADGVVHVLVAPMVQGHRELIAGLARDPSFGMTVMVGIGGILTEALGDVAVRLVPIDRIDAREMLADLKAQRLLGPVRGEPALDREELIDLLVGLSRLAEAEPDVVTADLNPLIIAAGHPVVVDALVEVAP